MTLHAVFAAAALSATGFAGDYGKSPIDKNVIQDDPWADAIRPITNPTLFDLAVPRTQLHPIFIYNSIPRAPSPTTTASPTWPSDRSMPGC